MNPDSAAAVQLWGHLILEWIGFGTLVGLLAKGIMPGRDPGGAIATLIVGIGGCVLGLGTVSYFWGQRITPISLFGLVVATVGAFVILGFYRLLAGYFFIEEGSGTGRFRFRPHFRRRRNAVVVEDN
jgi:uncharacterized membrane protein YeaQ/YmgE (transglycosylase-associated protein family)